MKTPEYRPSYQGGRPHHRRRFFRPLGGRSAPASTWSDVVLVDKGPADWGGLGTASGGDFQCVQDTTVEAALDDVVYYHDGLCDQDPCRAHPRPSPTSAIEHYERLGVRFERDENGKLLGHPPAQPQAYEDAPHPSLRHWRALHARRAGQRSQSARRPPPEPHLHQRHHPRRSGRGRRSRGLPYPERRNLRLRSPLRSCIATGARRVEAFLYLSCPTPRAKARYLGLQGRARSSRTTSS